MYRYRVIVWGPTVEGEDPWSHEINVTRQNPLTEPEALSLIKNMVREMFLEGSGEVEWEVLEIKDLYSGKTTY